ncbi:MAG TPA: adenylosuccinate lyase [Bacteroidia bacterium]|nr:adenylosuccinate lyase [Bacteroidia bacterium]
MEHTALHSISAVDGRYWNQTEQLSQYFSEFALIRYRLHIEVEYFIALSELPLPQLKDIDKTSYQKLRNIVANFSDEDANAIKGIEKVTNHDVKAVEYFLRDQFDLIGIGAYKEFIHFGLTSQDINNTAIPLSYKLAIQLLFIPTLEKTVGMICHVAQAWKSVPLLAHTHGQPASPTKLGKEFLVFAERVFNQLQQLKEIPFGAKFGGATGNFNAHLIAYPNIDWIAFANKFVNENLGLKRQQYTTQIEHYDNLAASFDALKRINTILIDFSRDVWSYISMNYFKQKLKDGEVGSSAMPHKVNPIDFENAEGNLGLANAMFEFFAAKLPVSRLQRDLTDSTVIRNIGIPVAHSMIALNSLQKGISKLIINETAIANDLENNWAVVAEALQTILRRENYPHPYNALKNLTRTNTVINKESLHDFIDQLNINEEVKQEMKAINPHNYTGVY